MRFVRPVILGARHPGCEHCLALRRANPIMEAMADPTFPLSAVDPCARTVFDLRMIAPHSAGDEDKDSDGSGGSQVGIATKTLTKPKKPSQYKVLMLNDDYTPMEFVVMVLKRFFGMDLEQATRVMLHVHQRGVGVCGIFTYEVAETKVNQVMDFARQNQHPLQCTLEKA